MRLRHFFVQVEPEIAPFEALNHESSDHGLPVFLQNDEHGYVAQLFIGAEWIRMPWFKPERPRYPVDGLYEVSVESKGEIDWLYFRLPLAGLRGDLRRPTIGDFAPPELQKKLPLSSGYSEILDKHFRDLAIEGPGWPKCRVVEFSRMQVIGGLRDNSSEFGVFGIDFAELWVDESGWNDAVMVWNAVTDDTVEDHPEGATVRLGTDELRLIRGAGAVRARLRAWTPFESRAGYRMRIADVEIVTTLGFSPKPFPAKVVAGDETWTALLQAEGDGVYRVLQGEHPFEPPLPYRSLVKLALVDGRLTLAEVVERSAWRTLSLAFYSLVEEPMLDEARVDEIERRIVDEGGVVSRDKFRGEVFCMHLPPGLDFDPVEELERLGFRRR